MPASTLLLALCVHGATAPTIFEDSPSVTLLPPAGERTPAVELSQGNVTIWFNNKAITKPTTRDWTFGTAVVVNQNIAVKGPALTGSGLLNISTQQPVTSMVRSTKKTVKKPSKTKGSLTAVAMSTAKTKGKRPAPRAPPARASVRAQPASVRARPASVRARPASRQRGLRQLPSFHNTVEEKYLILKIMKQSLYATQERLSVIQELVSRSSSDMRYRLAFVFMKLDQLVLDMRSMYSYLKYRFEVDRYPGVAIHVHIAYFTRISRADIDITYLVEWLLRAVDRLSDADRMLLAGEEIVFKEGKFEPGVYGR